MSTRVLPEPAGAMTRAGPPVWATAASWSGARSAPGVTVVGDDGERAEVDRVAVHDGSTPAGAGMRGPPSTHAGVPSGSVMSVSPSGVAAAPSASRAALTAHHHVTSPARAS